MDAHEVVLGEHPLRAEEAVGPPLGRDAPLRTLAARQAVGGALVIAGLIAVIVGWWGVAGTPETWKQFSYLASGGVGGAALIAVGVAVLISYEHARDRAAIAELLERLAPFEAVAQGLGAFDPDDLNRRLAAIEEALASLDGRARKATRR